jgi:hypothetical protein
MKSTGCPAKGAEKRPPGGRPEGEKAMRPSRKVWWAGLLGVGLMAAGASPAFGQGGGGGGGGRTGGGGSSGSGVGSGAGIGSGSGIGTSGASGAASPLAGGDASPLASATTTTGSSALDSANPFRGYYANPLAGGVGSSPPGYNINSLTSAFGQPIYGTSGSGSGTSGGSGGRTSGGTGGGGGAGGARTTTGSFGGSGGAGSGGSGGLSGTRTGGGGYGGGGAGMGGGGGGFSGGFGGGGGTSGGTSGGTAGVTTSRGLNGASIGNNTASLPRPRVAYAAVVRFPTTPTPPSAVQASLRDSFGRSPALRTPSSVRVEMDGATVVLRGSVEDDTERRTVEGMARLTPGLRELRNELQVRNPSPPDQEP